MSFRGIKMAGSDAFSTGLFDITEANRGMRTRLGAGALGGIAEVGAARRVGDAQLQLAKAQTRLSQAGASGGGGIGGWLGAAGSILGSLGGSFGGGSSGSGFSLGNSFTKDYGLGSFTGGAPNFSSFWNG